MNRPERPPSPLVGIVLLLLAIAGILVTCGLARDKSCAADCQQQEPWL